MIASHLLDAYHAAEDGLDADELRTEAVAALRRAARRAATVGAPETAERSYLTASEHASEAEQADLRRLPRWRCRQGAMEEALGLLNRAATAYTAARRDGRPR